MGAGLDVVQVWGLDLREVSGICERPAGHRRPRQLLEFGLPGARAEGLREDPPIAHASEFPTPPGSRVTFRLLTAWHLGGEAAERIGDLSDVTSVGTAGSMR
jgi:hypothetical protein